MQVVGVTFDSPGRNSAWAEDEGYQFELWTDSARELAMAYGAATSASAPIPDRITVILDAEGNQLLEYEVSSVGTHPGQVLADCEVLFGE